MVHEIRKDTLRKVRFSVDEDALMRALQEHGYCDIALGNEIIGTIREDGSWVPKPKILGPSDGA